MNSDIPSVYAIPGLFRLTNLIFEIPDLTQAPVVDERGIPARPVKKIAITMHLDGGGVRSRELSETYGGTSEATQNYEGHLALPDSDSLQRLQASLPADVNIWMSDNMPSSLVEGVTCPGTVNGQEGTIKLLPVEQTSIIAPYQAGFGDRVRIEFTRRIQWQGGA